MTEDYDKVKDTVVTREGDENSISNITVSAVRQGTPWREFEFEYRVAEDGVASLHSVTRTGTTDAKTVSIHHVLAVLSLVEIAVDSVPDVGWVEALEDTIKTRRPGVSVSRPNDDE